MARGNRIVAESHPRGRWEWGVINDTSSPGTIMQIDATVVPVNGNFGWKASAPGTDGLDVLKAVLCEDFEQGIGLTTAYTAGANGGIYMLQQGEYVNCLLGEVAGTGNTYAIGDKLMIDAESGILVPYAASPQGAFGTCMEVVTQVTGSHLTLVKAW